MKNDETIKANGAGEKESKSNTVKITAYVWPKPLSHFEALAQQRQRQTASDYQREAEYIGGLFLAASGEPGPDGNYGVYSASDLLTRLRPYLDVGNGWMADHGRPTPFAQAGASSSLIEVALMRLLGQGDLSQGSAMPGQEGASSFSTVALTEVQGSEQQEAAPFLYLDDLNLG
jgi:hypothetical protein